MDKFNCRSLNPYLVKPLSVIFGLEEAIISFNFLHFKEISQNIVI